MEKICGSCCWFCYEQTDGWGQCMLQEGCDSMHCSDLCTTDRHVSREEKRHYQAVMLQAMRFYENSAIRRLPPADDFKKAVAFSYNFMKVFGEI